MADVIEQFIRGSDNQIKLTLTENGVAISGAWTGLDIFIGDVVHIQRNGDSNGVALNTSSGQLTLTPADLIEDLSGLVAGVKYRVQFVVTDSENDDGVVFGANGFDQCFFVVSDKPT